MEDQAELITDVVERRSPSGGRMQSEADKAATDLIDSFLGSDQKVINLLKLPFGAFASPQGGA